MAEATRLNWLGIGDGFAVPEIAMVGVVVAANDCEVRVRTMRTHGDDAGTVKIRGWAPGTEVVRKNDVVVPVISAGENVHPADLTCPCGKVCSSTSGYSLHRKTCHAVRTAV